MRERLKIARISLNTLCLLGPLIASTLIEVIDANAFIMCVVGQINYILSYIYIYFFIKSW